MQLVWPKVYLLKPGANIGLPALRLRFILEHGMIRLRWLFLALGWSRGSMTRWLDARRHTRNFPSRPNVAPPCQILEIELHGAKRRQRRRVESEPVGEKTGAS